MFAIIPAVKGIKLSRFRPIWRALLSLTIIFIKGLFFRKRTDMQFLLWKRDLDRIIFECTIDCQQDITFYSGRICYVPHPKRKLHVNGAAVKLPDDHIRFCLLYTSDAADERSSVDL